jgi:hypothetical protein
LPDTSVSVAPVAADCSGRWRDHAPGHDPPPGIFSIADIGFLVRSEAVIDLRVSPAQTGLTRNHCRLSGLSRARRQASQNRTALPPAILACCLDCPARPSIFP